MIRVKEFIDKIGGKNQKLAADAVNEWFEEEAAQYQIIDIKYNTVYPERLGIMFVSILIVYDDNITTSDTLNKDNIENRLGS